MNLVRPEFVAAMEAELAANARKGDWAAWRPGAEEVVRELGLHLHKLRVALRAGPGAEHRVREHSADCAVLCMKVDEVFGGGLSDAEVAWARAEEARRRAEVGGCCREAV